MRILSIFHRKVKSAIPRRVGSERLLDPAELAALTAAFEQRVGGRRVRFHPPG